MQSNLIDSSISSYTASEDAIQCACDYMLNSHCGFPTTESKKKESEISVVFITDGHSNRGKCLHCCQMLELLPQH